MSQARVYSSNALAQVLGRAISAAAGLMAYVLVARFLGPEEFGRYAYALTFLGVAVALADFGTTPVLAKHIAEAEHDASGYWGNFLWVRLGLVGVVMLLALPAARLLRPDLFGLLALGCLGLPVLASRIFEPIFQVYERPWFSTICFAAYGAAYLAFTALCLRFAPRLTPVLLAYLAANALYAVLGFGLASRRLRPHFGIRRETLARIAQLAAPLGVGALFAAVQSRAAIFVLSVLASDQEVAIYSAAYRFLEMAAMIAAVLMNPAIPLFAVQAREDPARLKRSYVRIVEGLALVGLPFAIAAPHLSGPLIVALYGESFGASAPVLNVLAWVGVLVPVSVFTVALSITIGVVHFGYWNTALAATLSVALNFLWIPEYGVVGSAWAALVCEIQLLAVCFFYIVRRMGNVFRPAYWGRLGLLAAALALLLPRLVESLGLYALLLAAPGYVASAWLLRLDPRIGVA